VSSAALQAPQEINAKRPDIERPAVKGPTVITVLQSPKKKRKRQLEEGLLNILEVMPHGPHRSELIEVVDLAVAGMSIPKIAQRLGLSRSSVDRRLREVKAACKKRVAA
jgi:DNA-binding NarL/FixJ family response regulator